MKSKSLVVNKTNSKTSKRNSNLPLKEDHIEYKPEDIDINRDEYTPGEDNEDDED